nr:hypothetical protein [Corynebacterium lactis]
MSVGPEELSAKHEGEKVQYSQDSVARAAQHVADWAERGRNAWGEVPGIEMASCGVGFAEFGARLASAAERLRKHGRDMYAGLGDHAPAIKEQWAQFVDTEEFSRVSFGRIGVQQ